MSVVTNCSINCSITHYKNWATRRICAAVQNSGNRLFNDHSICFASVPNFTLANELIVLRDFSKYIKFKYALYALISNNTKFLKQACTGLQPSSHDFLKLFWFVHLYVCMCCLSVCVFIPQALITSDVI